MTIEQILPELLRLSRVDKVKVVQRLVGELTAEESVPIIASDHCSEVRNPDQAEEAAQILLHLLRSTETDDAGL